MPDKNTVERGGYSAGSRTVSELPPPPPSVSVKKTGTQQMTMGEFRELTADVPDDWPMIYVVRTPPDDFEFYPADASVDGANRTVDIYDA